MHNDDHIMHIFVVDVVLGNDRDGANDLDDIVDAEVIVDGDTDGLNVLVDGVVGLVMMATVPSTPLMKYFSLNIVSAFLFL